MSFAALDTAIKAKADANSTLNTALGALYWDEVPPNTNLPYWVCSDYTGLNKLVEAFGTGYVEQYGFEFKIYHTAKATAASLQGTLHNLFDRCSMTVTGATFMSCQRRLDSIVQAVGVTDEDGKPIYIATSRYMIQVNRTFGV